MPQERPSDDFEKVPSNLDEALPTGDAERRLVRKLDLVLLPLFTLICELVEYSVSSLLLNRIYSDGMNFIDRWVKFELSDKGSSSSGTWNQNRDRSIFRAPQLIDCQYFVRRKCKNSWCALCTQFVELKLAIFVCIGIEKDLGLVGFDYNIALTVFYVCVSV